MRISQGKEMRDFSLHRFVQRLMQCLDLIEIPVTHQSEIKTTFLLYFAAPTGMKVACDGMGAVSIIGRWKPFV